MTAVTPRSPEPERLPRLSRRALVLGSAGVLLAATAMAALGLTAESPVDAAHPARVAAPSSSAAPGQLSTLSLSEVRGHKPLDR